MSAKTPSAKPLSVMTTPTRYGLIARLLHWTMAVLMLAGYLSGEAAEDGLEAGASAWEAWAAAFHAGAGIALIGLLALRVLWRAVDAAPAAPAGAPAWETKAARWAHGALYVLMAAMPLSGLAVALTAGQPMTVGGLGWAGIEQISPLLSSRWLNKALAGLHEALSSALVAAVALHVAATLWHAVVRRDGVAARMVPFLSR